MSHPLIGRRWGTLTEAERAALPVGTVLLIPGYTKRKDGPGRWIGEDGDLFTEEPGEMDEDNVVEFVPGFAPREAPTEQPDDEAFGVAVMAIANRIVSRTPEPSPLSHLASLLGVAEEGVVDAVEALVEVAKAAQSWVDAETTYLATPFGPRDADAVVAGKAATLRALAALRVPE